MLGSRRIHSSPAPLIACFRTPVTRRFEVAHRRSHASARRPHLHHRRVVRSLELERNPQSGLAAAEVSALDQELMRVVRLRNNLRTALGDFQTDPIAVAVPQDEKRVRGPVHCAFIQVSQPEQRGPFRAPISHQGAVSWPRRVL